MRELYIFSIMEEFAIAFIQVYLYQTGAAVYLTSNRASHPLVESSKSKRHDGLPQEHPQAAEDGQKQYESSGRQLTK